MITIADIDITSDYTGTAMSIAESYSSKPRDFCTIGSIAVQATYTDLNAAVKIKIQQSVTGVAAQFDDIRDAAGDALELETGTGAGTRVLTVDSIHAPYFRVFIDSGSNSAGTVTLYISDTANISHVIKRS